MNRVFGDGLLRINIRVVVMYFWRDIFSCPVYWLTGWRR